MFDRRLVQNFDWMLFFIVTLLAFGSALNLYSASAPLHGPGPGPAFRKQVTWFLLGFGVFFLMITFNYKSLSQWAYPFYGLSLLLLLAVLGIGKVTAGSQRWIVLGPLTFQPSELAKAAVILVLAKFLAEHPPRPYHRLRDLWLPCLLVMAPSALILKEPDLGTTLLIGMIALSMAMMARIHWKSLVFLAGSAFLAAPLLWSHLKEYQRMRLLAFLSPEHDPLGAGYHVHQSKIAIGSGLVLGKGFLKGTQTRLQFLPEQHTDFAFSVFAEEWGFLGASALLLLYLLLILKALDIARNSKDTFGSMLAVGVAALLFWQVCINVAMTTGLLPVVGIPLVLFSYGGSSLLTTMAALGLLMNIRMRRFMFQ